MKKVSCVYGIMHDHKIVFEYKAWESVTELQHALLRPTWEELINKRRAKFRELISQCNLLRDIS